MFLRNYDNYMAVIHLQNTGYEYTHYTSSSNMYIGDKSVFGDGNANVMHTNGTVDSIGLSYSFSTNSSATMFPVSLCALNICIGTGNTAVTYDDYKLSGSAIDNTKLAVVSRKKVFDADTKKWKHTAALGYTNSTESDITISEWGLYFWNKANKSNAQGVFSNSSSNCVLMFREVLSEPVTIAAGTTGTLTFTLEIPTNHP